MHEAIARMLDADLRALTPPPSSRTLRRSPDLQASLLLRLLDEIDYGVKLLGIDHVGIGSDFDGVDGELPPELESVAGYPRLVAGLQARGYQDADIRKILGGNLLRTWAAVEAGAAR